MHSNPNRPIAWWLFTCCLMVFATLVVGGVTRLTQSGLSIVEWQPLIGALPPLTDAHWQELFARYQHSPQFVKVNADMTLDGFKFIFWWEWAHRLLARTIGLVFFLPFLWFLVTRRIGRALAPKLFVFFLLGGLQGAMGWYMVKSGLVDDPRVSQYRLAAHLGLAFLIFGLMLWTGLGLLRERTAASPGTQLRRVQLAGAVLTVLLFVMVLSGALVAGTHAGAIYNTFPLMGDHFVPEEVLALQPVWLNFFENHSTLQFDHRLLAWTLFILLPLFCWRARTIAPWSRNAAFAVLAMLGVQLALGISTLLAHVPLGLAATHQVGAMVVDRLRADAELRGDFLGAVALSNELQDLTLAIREEVRGITGRRVGHDIP